MVSGICWQQRPHHLPKIIFLVELFSGPSCPVSGSPAPKRIEMSHHWINMTTQNNLVLIFGNLPLLKDKWTQRYQSEVKVLSFFLHLINHMQHSSVNLPWYQKLRFQIYNKLYIWGYTLNAMQVVWYIVHIFSINFTVCLCKIRLYSRDKLWSHICELPSSWLDKTSYKCTNTDKCSSLQVKGTSSVNNRSNIEISAQLTLFVWVDPDY